MKLMNKIIILSAIFFVSFSCNNAYEDLTQDGELNEERAFQTLDDLERYLDGEVYGGLTNTSLIKFSSVITDELTPGSSYNSSDADLFSFLVDTDNGFVTGIWYNYYNTITRINRFFVYKDNVAINSDAEQERLNNMIAQARAIRAYLYLQLNVLFSTDPASNDALGVMVFEDVPGFQDYLPRSNNSAVYDLIEADIQYAEENLTNVDASNYYYVNIYFVYALKARMFAYREMYTEAAIAAQYVIDNSTLTLTEGTPYTFAGWQAGADFCPYRAMFMDQMQGENIFAIAETEQNGTRVATMYTTNSTDSNGSPLWNMGYNLFNAFPGADINSGLVGTDVRLLTSIDATSTLSDLVIDKYPGKGGIAPLINDQKIFRLSEMYLILAEAAASQSNFQGVEDMINLIRDRRDNGGDADDISVNNPTEAWKAILDERRLEFCFEGHRYIDIKRLGQKAGASVDRSPDDNITAGLPTTIPNNDFRFTMPIPADEVSANPNMTQNPGY